MPCSECDRLLELFLAAAKEHSDSVHAMINHKGEALERLTALAQSAQKHYDDCHEVFVAHQRTHNRVDES